MSAVWIAGLAIFLAMAMFLTLALCRCAALADEGIESCLPEEEHLAILLADLAEHPAGQPDTQGKQTASRLSHLNRVP